MPKPYAQHYIPRITPLNKIRSNYKNFYQGDKNLGGFKPAITLSSQIDEYVNSLAYADSALGIIPQIQKLCSEYCYLRSCCTQLTEKAEIAILIRHLYKLTKIQQKIDILANQSPYNIGRAMYSYGSIPESIMLEYRSELSHIKNFLDNSKIKGRSEQFYASFCVPLNDALSPAFYSFDFYAPSFTDKAKDIAFDGMMKIICFILFCGLFFLISKCTCG